MAPMNKFYGDLIRATITDNPEVVSAWISKIESIHPIDESLHPLIVGLSYCPKPVPVLRLCVGPDCLVYELINISEIPKALTHFLIEQCYTFVGAEIEVDLQKLQEDYGTNRDDIDAVDLWCVAAKIYGRTDLKNASLKQLLRLALDEKIHAKEEVEMLDNLRKALDAMLHLEKDTDHDLDAKVEYDCISTFVSFGLGHLLKANQFINFEAN